MANRDESTDKSTTSSEESQMNEFIAQYLNSESTSRRKESGEKRLSSDNLGASTHLVAIPLDRCYELLLELESVQRAIVYHCPVLADSCMPGTALRLPLLYVKAPEEPRRGPVATKLAALVDRLVREHFFENSSKGGRETDDIFNDDGHCPFTMKFQSLEVDGSNNNVLHTGGAPGDYRTLQLLGFVLDLQAEVESMGWETAFPPDPHYPVGEKGGFRPRVPFMALPVALDDILNEMKRNMTRLDAQDIKFVTSDEGGNGISPVLWSTWWDDIFGSDTRLREVALYSRSQGSARQLLSPSSDQGQALFAFAYTSTPLPKGNSRMEQVEAKHQSYHEQRLEEIQRQLEQPETESKTQPSQFADLLLSKTQGLLERMIGGVAESDVSTGNETEDPPV